MEKVNISERFNYIDEFWAPKIVGELNGQNVKLVKLLGEFVWHTHNNEDEMFFLVKGRLIIKLRDRDIVLNKGEFFIVPKGIEHKTIAEKESFVMVIEPESTNYPDEIKKMRRKISI